MEKHSILERIQGLTLELQQAERDGDANQMARVFQSLLFQRRQLERINADAQPKATPQARELFIACCEQATVTAEKIERLVACLHCFNEPCDPRELRWKGAGVEIMLEDLRDLCGALDAKVNKYLDHCDPRLATDEAEAV